MSVELSTLVNFTSDYLDVDKIRDYCPNGLQVEGRPQVNKIVGGVTASQELIDAAITAQADAILVHHGYFWKGENEALTGIKRNRIKSLLLNDVSLLAYHLPLDVHPVCGNNAQLAKLLGIRINGPLELGNSKSVGLTGELESPISAQEFSQLIGGKLSRDCFHIGDSSKIIKTVGFCTGAAQGMITHAVDQGLDAYISGEISEPIVHIAKETGVNYFSAGHHATERGGVQALGQLLAEQFSVQFEFIDIHNPV